jgi:dihydrofolate reductase
MLTQCHRLDKAPVRPALTCASITDATLLPGQRLLLPTGIAIAIPKQFMGIIKPRSGLAVRYGIDVLAGVIDSGYRGQTYRSLPTPLPRRTHCVVSRQMPAGRLHDDPLVMVFPTIEETLAAAKDLPGLTMFNVGGSELFAQLPCDMIYLTLVQHVVPTNGGDATYLTIDWADYARVEKPLLANAKSQLLMRAGEPKTAFEIWRRVPATLPYSAPGR